MDAGAVRFKLTPARDSHVATNVAAMFAQLGNILCVCPQCEELFYLSEARPYLTGKQPARLSMFSEQKSKDLLGLRRSWMR